MSAKLNSGKGAVSTGVFSSLQHAYSKIGKDLYHFLIENPLKAQAANGAAIRTAGKAVVNAATFGELHNTLYHPKPKPIQTGKGGNGNGANGGNGGNGGSAVVNHTSANIKFNLPPHQWSTPIDQTLTNASPAKQVNHSLRRAKMWCYIGADNSNYATNTGAGLTNGSANTVAASLDTQWGFQFLWNPTQIGSSIQRNANLIPQAMDAFAGRAPLFPGTEALSFVAVIDRVNDFACFKSDPNQAPYHAEYYGKSAGALQNTSALITDLMKKGTMADVEYIYKMINGDGANGTSWTNALGRKTADINFLAPTPVAIQFGPNADSLSYVGWVESLSIAHSLFTEDMIPIHTEVSINMSIYAQSSLSNG